MSRKIKVLVTGAGSAVGQGIFKSLKISKLNLEVYTCDINALSTNLYRSKKSFIIPKVEKANSLNWFIRFLKKEKIDVLMIGSEYEINFFAKNKEKIEKKTNTIINVSNYKLCKLADDKLATQEFLKNNKFRYLKTFKLKNYLDLSRKARILKFPFVLKDQKGTASRNVFLINKKEDLKKFFDKDRDQIAQEYSGFKGNNLDYEYTCSFFRTKEGRIIGPFVARRKLVNGHSWVVEVQSFSKISSYIKKLSQKINCEGSFNIQLRYGKKGPIPFEFNARFSGTTGIRAHFGFNEPEMFINNYLLGKKITSKNIKYGMCFSYNEQIFVHSTLKKLKSNFSKGKIKRWF